MQCAYSKCGQKFTPAKSWQKFCGDDCRRQNWQEEQGGELKLRVIELTQIIRHIVSCRFQSAECRSPLHAKAVEMCSGQTTDKEVRAAVR